MKKFVVAASLMVAGLSTWPVAAHHSFAMFDQTKIVVLNGTVKQFQWTNPHAWIELDVPGKGGQVTQWSLELNSPNNLSRQGWKRTSLKPG
jgi:phage-related protein